VAQAADQVVAMALAQIGPAAGNTTEKIAYAFDGPHLRLGVEILF
jgi:hypothetical protein